MHYSNVPLFAFSIFFSWVAHRENVFLHVGRAVNPNEHHMLIEVVHETFSTWYKVRMFLPRSEG